MGSTLPAAARRPREAALGALGVAFTCSYLVFFYVFRDAREIGDASVDGYLEVVLLGLPSIVLLGGALWVRESGIDRDLHFRAFKWAIGMGVVFAVAVAAVLYVIETRFDAGERLLMVLMSFGFGSSSGTVAGILRGRALQRERERVRTLARARRRERERQQLEHLNHYLRHEVLNEAQKIVGKTSLLTASDADPEARSRHLSAIRRSGRDIATFIQSIRTILDASDHDPELTPVDVVEVLEREAAAVGDAHPSASVTIDAPESARVLAGDLLDRVFRNLIENAIEHNAGEVTIAASVERGDGRTAVWLSDDGDGISTAARERLFEPPETGDHGYGLFFARNLVEVYGGGIELDHTGPDGTAFVVRLQTAGASTARPDGRAGVAGTA